MTPKRRNKLQIIEDKKIIYKWMMDGLSNHQIVNKLVEEMNYCRKNAYIRVGQVVKDLTPQHQDEANELKSKYLDMYHNLYQNAIINGDIRTANNILKNITELQGLNKINIDAKIENTFNIEF